MTSKKKKKKKKWRILKEVIRKSELIHSNLPRKIVIKVNVIFDEKRIANAFNNVFINIGPNLAATIPTATKSFKNYVQKTKETIKDEPITVNELNNTVFFLKINKSVGYDEISFSVIKSCFGELCDPLKYIFNLSFEKVILPDCMKTWHNIFTRSHITHFKRKNSRPHISTLTAYEITPTTILKHT